MTNTQPPSKALAHLAWTIDKIIKEYGEQAKIFIQEDGTLRIATTSVGLAGVLITRAERRTGLKLADYADIYQVRFWGSDLYASYFVTYNPAASGIQPRNGMIIDKSSPELIYPWRYKCELCGHEPRQHTRRCPNKRR